MFSTILGKENVVADALSRFSMCIVAHVEKQNKEFTKEVHKLALLGVYLHDIDDGSLIVRNNSKSSLVVEAKEGQHSDPLLSQLVETIHQQKFKDSNEGCSVLYYQFHLCVPNVNELRERILQKAHGTQLFDSPRWQHRIP